MRSHNRSERGAAMVEFALVIPLFLLLVFGIMEAGWMFAQQVEVRNAAREGGRLAVVDYPLPGSGDSTAIVTEVCNRASLSASSASVSIVLDNGGTPSDSEDDSAVVTVSTDYSSLTGFIPSFDSISTIASTAEMRIERDGVTWVNIPAPGMACP